MSILIVIGVIVALVVPRVIWEHRRLKNKDYLDLNNDE